MTEYNSELTVDKRREWVAAKYAAGFTPQSIWREYKAIYKLSKPSYDNDIRLARQELAVSVRDQFDDILNDQLIFLQSIMDKASTGDTATALRAQKQITDLLKLVNVKAVKSITFNQQVNTTQLPVMTVEEMRELLHPTKHKTSTGNQIRIEPIKIQSGESDRVGE